METLISHLRTHVSQRMEAYNQEIQKENYEYETFGKTFEKYLLQNLLPVFEGKATLAKNKNEYPDCAVSSLSLALDVKCGNLYVKKGATFAKTKNSNNDYGTIHSWLSNKLQQYEHHYVVFVLYAMNDIEKSIKSIVCHPVYNLIGVRNGVLSYREKDGNLRPKNFDAFETSSLSSMQAFKVHIQRTNEVRNIKISLKKLENIMEGLGDISLTERTHLADKLKDFAFRLERSVQAA